jgi:hypothetical protein
MLLPFCISQPHYDHPVLNEEAKCGRNSGCFYFNDGTLKLQEEEAKIPGLGACQTSSKRV